MLTNLLLPVAKDETISTTKETTIALRYNTGHKINLRESILIQMIEEMKEGRKEGRKGRGTDFLYGRIPNNICIYSPL